MTSAATEPLTCAALYECDPNVRVFVDEWVRERRCPLPLVDVLLEYGLTAAAECARWAATEPDLPVYEPLAEMHGERGGECGPYPACECSEKPDWVWCASIYDHRRARAFDVPEDIRTVETVTPTPAAAIVWLLDNWQVPTP